MADPTPPLLKDRSVFFVIGACAVTAATTWVVSENVRVKPLDVELQRVQGRLKALQDKDPARAAMPSAPAITDITIARLKNDAGGYDVEQNLYFKDAEGDARFISFVVLGTSASELKVTTHRIRVPAEQQVAGGVERRVWTCGRADYFVKLRAYVTDQAGNVSRPRDYTINC